MAKRGHKVKVVERKLGRIGAYGVATKSANLIELDPRMSERRRLTILVHEALHLARWDMTEREVTAIAPKIGKVLWQQGYRRTHFDT